MKLKYLSLVGLLLLFPTVCLQALGTTSNGAPGESGDISLKEDLQKDSKKLQRLYKRRNIGKDGRVSSNWSIFNTYQ